MENPPQEIPEAAPPAAAPPDLNWPVPIIPLPAAFNVESSVAQDGTPVVVVSFYAIGGGLFLQFTRDDALVLASRVRKAAQTGPGEEQMPSAPPPPPPPPPPRQRTALATPTLIVPGR